ncbi:hypothetical protein ATCC90586_008462 [Pythium insidiosum]|nr:hypothetical protein ATCC90586_008462 [Pythium insidiosum]
MMLQHPSQSDMTPPASSRSLRHADVETMQQQMAAFLRDDILESAQLLGDFLVALATSAAASSAAVAPSLAFHSKSFELFGDLLRQRGEHRRAIQYYKRFWRLQPSATEWSSDAVSVSVKLASCWMALDNPHQAIEALHAVPHAHRTLRLHLLIGRLYRDEGLKTKAEDAYRQALRLNPYALEASVALAELAAARESSLATGAASSNSDSVDVTDAAFWQREMERFTSSLTAARPSSHEDAAWLQTLVTAHIHSRRGRYRAAMDCFDALDALFPNNLHCMLHKGKLEMEQEFFHQAHLLFQRARQVDELNVLLMDVYADCLRRNGARVQLGSLVHDLFEATDRQVQPWLAAAYLNEVKGDYEAALQLCERAILMDRWYAAAHLFRGTLLLHLQRPEHALLSFTTSCKLQKTLDAYSGIVMSYCELCVKGLSKYKEALSTAKTAVKLYPQKAQSYTLLGNVFALRPEHQDQARKAFQRALATEPRKLAAAFGLVDLLLRDGQLSAAIDKLVVIAEQNPREEVFTKLGDVYTMNKQFGDAMTCYHRALSLQPASAEAARGLDRLEKIMRGEDPDELNTTMDHMEGDEHEDSMEAGEYGP